MLLKMVEELVFYKIVGIDDINESQDSQISDLDKSLDLIKTTNLQKSIIGP